MHPRQLLLALLPLLLVTARGGDANTVTGAPMTEPRSITALTDEDRKAVCALYGTPSYCNE